MPGGTKGIFPRGAGERCRGTDGSFVLRSAGFQPALFLECGGWTPLSPRFVGAGFSPSLSSSFSPHSPAAVAGHSPLLYGAGGQTGSFPYSETFQSLRAKRSISHEHQKTSRLSPISPDFHRIDRSDDANAALVEVLAALKLSSSCVT